VVVFGGLNLITLYGRCLPKFYTKNNILERYTRGVGSLIQSYREFTYSLIILLRGGGARGGHCPFIYDCACSHDNNHYV